MAVLYIVVVLGGAVILSWPVGMGMTWAMQPSPSLDRYRRRLVNVFVHLGGRVLQEDQGWKKYSLTLLLFNAVMFMVVFFILAFQKYLPLNPDGKGALDPGLIFNTVASFVTNTDIQHYSGEVSMSYFSQVAGLMWLQFVSAGTGIAALVALCRGLAGNKTIGNFYRDLIHAVFLVLLPLSFVVALILVLAGVPMTLGGAVIAHTLEGPFQTIARGPVAAFEAIKQLGTNGGGFFGANSTHPFENPTFFTNMVECICILIIPMACVWMFGRITGRKRHAAVVFVVMTVLLIGMVTSSEWFERAPTPAFRSLPVLSGTGNLEGKELRFGFAAGPLWAALTTATSNGSVDCMHDSLNPLTGLVPLIGMWLNVAFGGVGVGLINMFLYIIVGVFICGMMVGRTPEYLTRKVETREMKLALLALLLHPLLILGGTALFAATSWGTSVIHNAGAHGFTEILYEFSSAAANNGSEFAGLSANTVPFNLATGVVMLLARFVPIILPLAIAGSLAGKKPVPETNGTFRTDGLMFGLVLLGTVIFIGALLFLPAAVLGPVTEHLSVIR